MEYSLEEGIKKIRMPLLVASVNGIELTFLIDTGASNNVIASFVYDQLQEGFVLLGKQFKMMGVEGNYNTVATVETFLSFRNLNIKTTFSVVNLNDAVIHMQQEYGLQVHGFLGIPFLIDNKCIIDFDKMSIKIGTQ